MYKKINWKDKQLIEKIVKESITQTEVLKKIGYGTSSGNFQTLLKYINLYKINIEHFKGKTIAYQKLKNLNNRKELSDKDFFIKGTHRTNKAIRNRILKNKIKEHKCEDCGCFSIWNNKLLVLQIDHINGDTLDNRLENLRFLCPNCHSQTPTFSGKKLKNKNDVKKEIIFNIDKFEENREAPLKEEIIKKIKEIGVYNTSKFFNMSKSNFNSLCNYYNINLEIYIRKYKISGIDKVKFQYLVLEKSLKELEIIFSATGNAIKKQAIKEKIFLPTTIHKSYWAKIKNKSFSLVKFEDLDLINEQYVLSNRYIANNVKQ